MAPFTARKSMIECVPPLAQRQSAAVRRHGAPLDRRRDARSRAPVPPHHRPTPTSRRSPSRSSATATAAPRHFHANAGDRYARDRLTITPRTPPRGSTATETSSSWGSVSRCSAEGRCRSCCASRWCRPSHERGALPWPSWQSGGPWSERRPCRRCSSRASGLRPCWLTLTRRTRVPRP
jgi:hypothetical protein